MIRLRPAEPEYCPAMADILQDWIEATSWMPVLHGRNGTHAFLRRLQADAEITVPYGVPVTGFLARNGAEIDALYLAPEARGRGVGTALIQAAQAECTHLRLWCFQRNAGALRFYERCGFREPRRTDGLDNDEKLPDVRLEWSRA